MDFTPFALSAEHKRFRAEVREWLATHAPRFDGSPHITENYVRLRQLGRDLGRRGWLYPTAPARYGGGGLTVDHAAVISEELEDLGLDNPPYYDSGGRLAAASMLEWAAPEQQGHYLPLIFRGEIVTWQLLTGPDAGSDLAATTTAARRDGGDYILDGNKVFVGGSQPADYYWTLVRTDPQGPRHRNLSWFMVPAKSPGITVKPMELLGDGTDRRAGHFHKNTIYLDGVRVPAAALIGGENNGWAVARTHLDLEHGTSGRAGANRWMTHALDGVARARATGLASVGDADVLADIFILGEVERLLGLRNYWLSRTRRPMSYEGPQLSYITKISGLRVAEALHELLGPSVLTDDPEWDRSKGELEAHQRHAIVALHPGGTADIQKLIIARRLGVGRPAAAVGWVGD